MSACIAGKVYKKGGNKKTNDIDPGMGGSHPGVSQGQGFKKGGLAMSEDVAQDKKLIKKAMTLHDRAKHGGEKATELKNLKSGGCTMKKGGKATQYKAKKKSCR